jgi:hypothetical protein
MKRMLAARCLLISLILIPTLSLLLGFSLFIDPSPYHGKIVHSGNVWNHASLMLLKGDIMLFNQFEVDKSGRVIPWIDNNPAYTVPTKNRRGGRFTIPGFGLRYGQVTRDGDVAWSLKISLVFPLILSVLTAAFLRRHLRRRLAASTPRPDNLERLPQSKYTSRP